MELLQAKASRLKEAELVALRFYTSHSFNALNVPMRDFDRQGPHPLPAIMMNIQTALKKLRALGAEDASSKQTVVLWRGMSYMQLPQKFSAEGGTELAPMSTTTDVSVAISCAVKKDTRSALLFRFVTRNNLERGADVQWLSMFPGDHRGAVRHAGLNPPPNTSPQQRHHHSERQWLQRHTLHSHTQPLPPLCLVLFHRIFALCGGRCSRRRLAMDTGAQQLLLLSKLPALLNHSPMIEQISTRIHDPTASLKHPAKTSAQHDAHASIKETSFMSLLNKFRN
jgi:hypothetical protein